MRITFSFAGALRTGGLLLLACVSLPLLAQQRANRPVEKSARVIERGAHHATWETVRELADPLTGETVSVTNSYVQLESGLHFQDAKGEWLEASDQIEIVSGHAVAKQGQHQARWAANINTFGAIELWTPEGELARSHVLGLAFYDPTTGESSMIAEIKDSIGVVTGNQVIYEDAFDGVVADLRYTYTKAGFVQDVILREQLPDPVELGFDPATVQVQVLTEFVELPAVTRETVDAALLSARTNQLSEAVSAARYAQDGDLRLGTMTMNQGRAFSLPATERESAPVR